MLVARTARSHQDIDILIHNGYDYQVAEAMVRACLTTDPQTEAVRDDTNRSKWEWYKDCGYEKSISREGRLSSPPVALPHCLKTVTFRKMYYNGDVKELEENTLYYSTVHNAPVANLFCVDQSRKVVYALNSTANSLRNHSFNAGAIKIFMESMQFFVAGNDEYKVVLIGVTDWSRRSTNGMKFINSAGMEGSLKDFKKDKSSTDSEIFSRLDSYIVRACFYPQVPKELI